MAHYAIRNVPEGLIPRAKQKAREAGTTLDVVLVAYLTQYAQHGCIQSSGGYARSLSLSPERKSEIAKAAVAAREAKRHG